MTLYAHVSISMRASQFVFICTDIAFHLHKRHGLTCRSLHVCHTFVLMHQSTLFTSAHNPLGLRTAISHSRCITDPLRAYYIIFFYCSQVYHDIVCSCFDQYAGISVCVHLYRHCISFAQETWPDMSLPACVPHICINASKHLVHISS